MRTSSSRSSGASNQSSQFWQAVLISLADPGLLQPQWWRNLSLPVRQTIENFCWILVFAAMFGGFAWINHTEIKYDETPFDLLSELDQPRSDQSPRREWSLP